MKQKKLILLLLFAILKFPLYSQDYSSHDNRLYITVGESSDLSRVPVTLHLDNPTIEITALELYLNIPEGSTLSLGTLNDLRCTSHELIEGETEQGHFVSIVSPELESVSCNFGVVCTWNLDLSTLSDRVYTISAISLFAVGLYNDVISHYTVEDQTNEYTISNGVITAIYRLEPETSNQSVIYNLQGIRVSEPQKGINIINGKKVKR